LLNLVRVTWFWDCRGMV